MNGERDGRERADLIVVGAGLAGLTAAAIAAREGRSVIVLEKAGRAGGRAATTVRDGVHLNLGPHALYRAGHAAATLADLRVPVSGHAPGPGRARLVGRDRIFRLPKGLFGMLGSGLLTWSEKRRLVRFFSELPRIDARALDRTPLADWIGREFGRGGLASFLQALFRVSTYAADHARLSAGAALDQFRLGLAGVLYLDGGWQSLIDGLRQRAVADGADVRVGASAVAVASDDDGATVRLAGGDALRGRSLILAVDPESARRLLGLPADHGLARHPTIRAACLDLALDRLPRPSDRFALGLDRPHYYSVHSAAARLAPDGVAVVHVAKYLDGGADDPAAAEAELEGLMDRLQPGWRDHVRQRRFFPGMVVAHALPEAESGGLAGRPGVEVADRPGVFLAGDWVGADGMLADASAASAATAARLALARIGRDAEAPARRPAHV